MNKDNIIKRLKSDNKRLKSLLTRAYKRKQQIFKVDGLDYILFEEYKQMFCEFFKIKEFLIKTRTKPFPFIRNLFYYWCRNFINHRGFSLKSDENPMTLQQIALACHGNIRHANIKHGIDNIENILNNPKLSSRLIVYEDKNIVSLIISLQIFIIKIQNEKKQLL